MSAPFAIMEDDCEPESIEDVLDCVEQAGNGDTRVSVADIVERIGDGAFAPLMLVPALVMISPLTAMFGVSTVCGLVVALIAFQMVIGRERLWLPGFVLRRTVSSRRLDRTVGWFARPARFVDAMTGKRLTVLVDPPLTRVWALLCLVLALVIPALELVPMSATVVASAIALFGLAMLARDGLLALLGLAVLGGACWLVWNIAT